MASTSTLRRQTSRLWLSELARRRPANTPLGRLLRAFELLNQRGTGVMAWAAPFRDDPLAFLLDSMTDPVRVWSASGELLFQNRTAALLDMRQGGGNPLDRFTSRGKHFERRSLHCTDGGDEYVIEVAHEVQSRADSAAPEPSSR